MLIVKLKMVNGQTEIFHTEGYIVSTIKEMMPEILEVKVYIGNKVIKRSRRKFQWFYKKFLYKPSPNVNIQEQQPVQNEEPHTVEMKPATTKKPRSAPKKKTAKKE